MSWKKKELLSVAIDIETIPLSPTQAELDAASEALVNDGISLFDLTDEMVIAKAEDAKKFSFHGKKMVCAALGVVKEYGVEHIQAWSGHNLEHIVLGMADYLNDLEPYRLIGHNHVGFDLPEVAKSFFQCKVKLKNRPGKWDLIDTNKHPFFRVKLKDIAVGLGLPTLDVNGSNVQELVRNEDWAKLEEYNKHDVYLSGMVYIAMSTVFNFE